MLLVKTFTTPNHIGLCFHF